MTTTDTDYAEALKCALDLLSRREHTARELQRKLNSRGFEDEVIASVLDYLVSKNYLSDLRFAEAFVRARINKGYGERDLYARLSEKGVSKSIASDVIVSLDINWYEKALDALQKKARGSNRSEFKSDDGQKLRAKYARFLQSRGFGTDQIVNALEWLNEKAESG